MKRVAALWTVAAAASILVVMGAAPTVAAKKPVKITGSVNVHGKADVSTDSEGELEVELDDFYLSPTFTKAAPGETITVKLKNEGTVAHTFTSDALGVNEQVSPGATKTVEITVPDGKGAYRVYCRFHRSSGMQGAVYTASGATVTDKAAGAAGTSGSGSTGSGSSGSSSGNSSPYDY